MGSQRHKFVLRILAASCAVLVSAAVLDLWVNAEPRARLLCFVPGISLAAFALFFLVRRRAAEPIPSAPDVRTPPSLSAEPQPSSPLEPWFPEPAASVRVPFLDSILALVSICMLFFMLGMFRGCADVTVGPESAVLLDLVFLYLVYRTFGSLIVRRTSVLRAFLIGPSLRRSTLALAYILPSCLWIWLTLLLFRSTPLYGRHVTLFDDFVPHNLLLLTCAVALRQLRLDSRLLYILLQPTSRQPLTRLVLDDVPSAGPDAGTRICHLTDLHLTRPGHKNRALNGGRTDLGERFRELLANYLGALEKSSVILVTGDVTDTCAPQEWRSFFSAFRGMEGLLAKTVLVPGNHDVNLSHSMPWFVADNEEKSHRSVNIIRCLTALDRIQGDRAWIANEADEVVMFRDWLKVHRPKLAAFVAKQVPRHRGVTTYTSDGHGGLIPITVDVTPHAVSELINLPPSLWKIAFPMCVTIPGCDVRVIVVNSNVKAHGILDNAFGFVDERQLKVLRRFADDAIRSRHPVVLAVHHHLGNPPESERVRGLEVFEDRALTLTNALELIGSLPVARRWLAFNGHRHIAYTAIAGSRVIAIAGASSTLGDAREGAAAEPWIGLFRVRWTVDGDLDQVFQWNGSS
jgi:Calcineurin-like phosphoesterase